MTQSLPRVALIIMDGYGLKKNDTGNAVTRAKTPNLTQYNKTYQTAKLDASGLAVGLPRGQMGNSEVGHLNIGAGRVVYQDITAIDKSIADGDFFTNPAFVDAVHSAAFNNTAVHLLGLVSDGGVHSHINHLYALIDLCKRQGVKNVLIHAITDGRDTPPRSAEKYITALEKYCAKTGVGKIATISGRYYTMDRDNRWDRIKNAYDCIIDGSKDSYKLPSAMEAIKHYYSQNINDEFFWSTIVAENFNGIANGDSLIFFNFRSDRAKQFTRAVTDPHFAEFPRTHKKINFVTMTEYDANLKHVTVAFPPKNIVNTLGEVLQNNRMSQIRLAETEKYAHVTFFFDGGKEQHFHDCTQILVPSPKVATYDLQPEMSAPELTRRALTFVSNGNPNTPRVAPAADVLIMNFANCDMVGHTGNVDAAIRAVETVDKCVGEITSAIVQNGGTVLITADHGNAEQMIAPDGTPFTAHTTNPVPLIIAGKDFDKTKGTRKITRPNGALRDIAPTILKLLSLPVPPEMDGTPLI